MVSDNMFPCRPDYVFKTDDHPKAGGRIAVNGEQAWTLRFQLERGETLEIAMGRASFQTFRNFVLRMELDDAADEAASTL